MKRKFLAWRILLRDRRQLIVQLERPGHLVGKFLDLRNDIQPFGVREVMDAAKEQREERDDGQLRGERLGRRHADLRSGVHVNPSVALARDCAGDIVADAQRAMALALALAQSSQSVGGLPALADDEHECVARHRQVAVSQFAGELALDRNMGERLDEILADHGRVESGAATAEDDSFDLAQLGIGHFQAAELRRRFFNRETSAQRVAQRSSAAQRFP